jgi:hypothetical protein
MGFPIMPMVFLGSSAVSAFGEYQAGRAADRAGKMEAKQYATRRKQVATETSAALRERARTAYAAEGRNRLAMAMSGFTEDSFGAVFAGDERLLREDLETIQTTGVSQEMDLRVAGAAARAQGAQARRAGTIAALGTIAGAAFQYEVQRPPGAPSLIQAGQSAARQVRTSLVNFSERF